jgi:hypothetical protein
MLLAVHKRTYAYVLRSSRSRLLSEDVIATAQQEAGSGGRHRIFVPGSTHILFLVF